MSQPCFWTNGKRVAREDARVDLLANALHYGTGVFEESGATMQEGNPRSSSSSPIWSDLPGERKPCPWMWMWSPDGRNCGNGCCEWFQERLHPSHCVLRSGDWAWIPSH